MSIQGVDPGEETPRRDRTEHGGAPPRPDDDELAHRTEDERVEAGLDDYNPDDVPSATQSPLDEDITASPEYQAEAAEVRREAAAGELPTEGAAEDFPPTRYDRS